MRTIHLEVTLQCKKSDFVAHLLKCTFYSQRLKHRSPKSTPKPTPKHIFPEVPIVRTQPKRVAASPKKEAPKPVVSSTLNGVQVVQKKDKQKSKAAQKARPVWFWRTN
eukprot:NODE_1198_length_1053_cov_162.417331_g929_i0.p2 GENE.NODE_1198_length_1053_cov_162.417331_g929_i0~~NODE_1198_length_1053_cov_162.417331_g929_i0.p2  ORF type:complete len:108 (-),score=20.66 NODE_1198_length_1053_cov_162.417331_g929_i0:431-754(-)